MSIFIGKSGILTTVQDLGRYGYRRFGVNPGGVMDTTAARLVNILLGNNESEAVLEMHFPTGEFEFERPVVFALGGADFGARLNEIPVDNWRMRKAEKGAMLKFTKRIQGNRAYLAIKGGFEIDKWLGGSSTNLAAGIGGFRGRKIITGDRIGIKTPCDLIPKSSVIISSSMIPQYGNFPTVRFTRGPEFDLLDPGSREILLKRPFSLSNDSSRMGYRLSGETLSLIQTVEMVSSAVTFGTLQLLPNGRIIVLMADHQTTGGYPRIGHIICPDLPLLAQLGPKDRVTFELISNDNAEKALIRFESELNIFKTGCGFLKFESNVLV